MINWCVPSTTVWSVALKGYKCCTDWVAPPVYSLASPRPRPPRLENLRPPLTGCCTNYRIYLIHRRLSFNTRLSDLVPLENGFNSFHAHLNEQHPVDPGTRYTAVVPRGVADLYPWWWGHTTSNTRDRSITHSLQRWVSTKSSISQLDGLCFIFIIL